MSNLSSLWLKKETLKTLYQTLEKKGEKGVEITISTNDETNEYGQNVAAFVRQSKEDRKAKKKRFYVGNGKCFWTDGTIKKAVKPEDKTEEVEIVDDDDEEGSLPF